MTVPQLRPLPQEGSRVPANGNGWAGMGHKDGREDGGATPRGRGTKPNIGQTGELRPLGSRA